MNKKPETIASIDKECLSLWSKCIIIRDRVCRVSGSDSHLSSHHIRSRGHAATRYDLNNGLALSWGIHRLQKLNPERFFDMIIEVIGEMEYGRLKIQSQRICKRHIADLREERERLKNTLKQLENDWGKK